MDEDEEEGKQHKMMLRYQQELCWRDILGDIPSRLEFDYSYQHDSTDSKNNNEDTDGIERSENVSRKLILPEDRVRQIMAFCQERKVSLFTFALHVLHHTMRGFSHEAFAVGVSSCDDSRLNQVCKKEEGMADMMMRSALLFPFQGGRVGGNQTVEDVHRLWAKELLPLFLANPSSTPHLLRTMGYGSNIHLAFQNFDEEKKERFGLHNAVTAPDGNDHSHQFAVNNSEDFDVVSL